MNPIEDGVIVESESRLSRACHYHPYELARTAAELTGWIADVEALVAELLKPTGSS